MFRLAQLLIIAACAMDVAAQSTPIPGSPAANFLDDALLRTAQSEIVRMPRHQLDVLTDLLATCFVTDQVADDAERRPCDIAMQRYSIGYGRLDATHRILVAIGVVSAVNRLAHRAPVAETGRFFDIYTSLSTSITQRNRALAGSK